MRRIAPLFFILNSLFLAVLLLFGTPLLVYGPAIAQSAQEAGDSETAPAQLLLFPDPVRLTPGASGVVDVRLHTSAPVYEAHITLTLDNPNVHFADLFLGTGTPFRIFDRHIGADEASFVLQAPEGFTGQRVIGRVLLEASQDAAAGERATLDYGGSTTVLGPDSGHSTLDMRPTQVRIGGEPAIEITSTTHPDEGQWYRRRSANVTWGTGDDALFSYDISPLPADIPDDEPDEPVGAIEMRDLEDGIWYFALCELQEGECGEVTRRRYMIDSTPPKDFSVRLEQREDGVYASFTPHDEQSDIARIEAALDPEAALTSDRSAWIEVESPYRLPAGHSGDLLIRAQDLAGNTTIARARVPSGREARTTAALLLIFSSAFAAFALWHSEKKAEAPEKKTENPEAKGQ